MGHELIVLGVAFLLAGLLARAGRRIGLQTIAFFMAAGILVGPNTPGPVVVEWPGRRVRAGVRPARGAEGY